VDGRPLTTTLRIAGRIRRLTIERSIVGSIATEGVRSLVEHTTITDSIVQGHGALGEALSIESGMTKIARVTVLGDVRLHQIEATDSIFDGEIGVADHREGCVRYSAYAPGSMAPRPYACTPLPEGALFASRAFGNPAYARLRSDADRRIASGSEAGTEMGAFSKEDAATKERALLSSFEDQMPLGLAPVVIHAT
jgi:hypothetical protein